MNGVSGKKFDVLILGSGAAGLASALRLHALGVENIAIFTEGLRMGTSINTGSDKQTYYKLGMYGSEPDSPRMLAEDLFAGNSVHGDIAFAEAASSVPAFFHLVNLGVPFPHDEFGEYIGYKTDHDPKRRATSCGPYTSRDMCRALISEVRKNGIPVYEHRIAVSLLKTGKRCSGAVFINTESEKEIFEHVFADDVIFAVGGPGGLYEKSVYPKVHTGAIGLAFGIGAKARNLAESQYGLASLKFRWNVSGSYMQVLPRFVSVDSSGCEREFLREYFPLAETMYDMIFLKGYQWPFAAGHVPGSSLIDLFVHIETAERGRRVYLDYRTDPDDFNFEKLSAETRGYLVRSGALGKTPFERLEKLNAPAIELYREHGIRLDTEMLEVAVCAQHNNGGLAGNFWWESENISRFFPVGEVNGSHGVTRPGGSALNAGQAGAFRASEFIASVRGTRPSLDLNEAWKSASDVLRSLKVRFEKPAVSDWKKERSVFQKRMSDRASFIRESASVTCALSDARTQYKKLDGEGLGGLSVRDAAESLRNLSLLLAQIVYLEAIKKQIDDHVGSRGGSIVLSGRGNSIHSALSGTWRILQEDPAYRKKTLETIPLSDGTVRQEWIPCRPLPVPDGWFESVWKDFRDKKIYG